jgi:nicotinamide-nucleotide amidase
LKVRITAKADDDAAAEAILEAEEQVLLPLLGEYIFGRDDESMEVVVLQLLQERGLTLAVAESVTGGVISARLTDAPGASKAFKGGVVSYFSEVKYDLLDVPEGPVVTLEAAKAMADGVRKLLGADVGLGVTGVAGPEEQEGQPVGTVFLGWAVGDEVDAVKVQLPGDRKRIREFATISLLDLLRRRLLAR